MLQRKIKRMNFEKRITEATANQNHDEIKSIYEEMKCSGLKVREMTLIRSVRETVKQVLNEKNP